MAQRKIMFRVLLSSASDVEEERNIVNKIVNEINRTNNNNYFGIEVFRWETDTPPSLILDNAQISIDKTFDYKHADLLIAIFHKKLGQGTIHEIDEAIKVREQYGLIDIKLYFKDIDKNTILASEKSSVTELEKQKSKYMQMGIVGKFETPDIFNDKCRVDIQKFFDTSRQVFLREYGEERLRNKFIPEVAEPHINSYKMCFYRNEIAKISIKDLSRKTSISVRKLQKYEKIIITGNIRAFPTCPIKDLISIENALSINRGSLATTLEETSILKHKDYYDKNKGLSTSNNEHVNKNKKYKAVVFDFDGTIADPNSLRTTWQKLWEELNLDLNICSDLHRKFDKHEITHQEWCDLTAEYFINAKMQKKHLQKVANTIKIIDGFKQTIEKLSSSGMKLYILSGSIKDIIVQVLGDYTEYFDDISANEFIFDSKEYLVQINGTEFDFEGKANYIRRLIDNIQIPAKQVLFIGNSFNDAHVYKSGARTLCINPHQTNAHNTRYWHYCIDNTDDLTDILAYCI